MSIQLIKKYNLDPISGEKCDKVSRKLTKLFYTRKHRVSQEYHQTKNMVFLTNNHSPACMLGIIRFSELKATTPSRPWAQTITGFDTYFPGLGDGTAFFSIYQDLEKNLESDQPSKI